VNVYDVDEGRVLNNGHYYSQSHSTVSQQYSPYNHTPSPSVGVAHALQTSQNREHPIPELEPAQTATPSKSDSLSPCTLTKIYSLLVTDSGARWRPSPCSKHVQFIAIGIL
jgi:hypothetical protein